LNDLPNTFPKMPPAFLKCSTASLSFL